jgi:predicted Zn-dependent protease
MNIDKHPLLSLALVFLLPPTSMAAAPAAAFGAMTPAAIKAAPAALPPLMEAMTTEMNRALAALQKSAQENQPAPYFLSYLAHDVQRLEIVAEHGAILRSNPGRWRNADIVIRVGDAKVDNTHGNHRSSALHTIDLPLADDRAALARSLWRGTNTGYSNALQSLLKVKSELAVHAKEEDSSADFSAQPPVSDVAAPLPAPVLDKTAWEGRMRSLSALFRSHPQVSSDSVSLSVSTEYDTFVSSEGSRLAYPKQNFRIVVLASTRAEDGMDLRLVRTFEGRSEQDLPPQAELEKQVGELATQLDALRAAPPAEPFDGPVLLAGRASAVFFHEVLGHRLEGQRQRGTQEGETFTKDVGKPILPAFLSVADDPTLESAAGVHLNGFYRFDDEGQPAQRVELVDKGVLQQFLMSRMPIAHFDSSNGHGRAQAGRMPIGRQGNLIVTAAATKPEKKLREMLIEEIKKQKKPYGLYFADIASGYTLTQRILPQAFQVIPQLVYRVYGDGRLDELVRGVNIVGTPQASLLKIVAAGDRPQVFNGECGAESGSVPVAAVAPALLFSEMETQKAAQGNARPPLLPAPLAEATAKEDK